MSSIRVRLLGAFAVVAAAAMGADAHAQNVERGRLLYENHCQACHTAQVHGRKNRIALSRAELVDIVDRWQKNQKLAWNAEEIGDVVQYLATTRYRFE
jgi:mono/diheme cytochrome c family protein